MSGVSLLGSPTMSSISVVVMAQLGLFISSWCDFYLAKGLCWALTVYAFNPGPQEAETGRSL